MDPHGSTCSAADSPGSLGIDLELRRHGRDRADDDADIVSPYARSRHAEREVAAALRELLEGEAFVLAERRP